VNNGFVWLSYLLTYGVIVGYVVVVTGRFTRSKRNR
jgi:hypothetical protein